jgi:hypothetical protein
MIYIKRPSRMGMIIGIVAVFFGCLAQTHQAEDFLVIPSDCERNPGTEAEPSRSITAVLFQSYWQWHQVAGADPHGDDPLEVLTGYWSNPY